MSANFENVYTNLKSTNVNNSETGIDSTAIGREAHLLLSGIGGAVASAISNPTEHIPDLALSTGVGSVLGAASRTGAAGKFIVAGAGTAMLARGVYQELTGDRWSTFGSAVKDAWQSGANMDSNIDATKNSLGTFVVSNAVGAAGFKIAGHLVGNGTPELVLRKHDDFVAFRNAAKGSSDDWLVHTEVPPWVEHFERKRADQLFSHVARIDGKPAPLRRYDQSRMIGIDHFDFTHVVSSRDGVSRIVSDSSGRINQIQVGKYVGQENINHLRYIAGYARLIETDPLALKAAQSSTLVGRLGIATNESIAENAVSGANAYLRWQPGNAFTNYLVNRYGRLATSTPGRPIPITRPNVELKVTGVQYHGVNTP